MNRMLTTKQTPEVNGKVDLITDVTARTELALPNFCRKRTNKSTASSAEPTCSSPNHIDYLYKDPHDADHCFIVHYGDMTDSSSLIHMLQKTQLGEINNLPGQRHVAVSF